MWGIGRLALGATGSLTLVTNAWSRDAGLPGLLVLPAKHARSHAARGLAALAARLDCPDVAPAWRCRLGLELGAVANRYRIDDPALELGLASAGVSHASTRFAPRAWFALAPLPELDFTLRAGAEAGELALGALRASRRTLRTSVDAAVRPLPGLELVAIAALECHLTRGGESASAGPSSGAGGACDELEPLARLGARIELWASAPAAPRGEPQGSLALRANAGRYARVPTLAELHGLSAVVRGNPELTAERGYSADLGLSATLASGGFELYAELVGYLRFADALIAYRRSSLGVLRPYNAARARILGAELTAGAGLGAYARLELVASLGDARDTSPERTTASDLVPLESRLALEPTLALAFPLGAAGACELSLRLGYGYHAARPADPAGLVVLGAQHELEQEIGLAFDERRFALRARISNLLGEHAYDLVGYPLPGRALYTTLEAAW